MYQPENRKYHKQWWGCRLIGYLMLFIPICQPIFRVFKGWDSCFFRTAQVWRSKVRKTTWCGQYQGECWGMIPTEICWQKLDGLNHCLWQPAIHVFIISDRDMNTLSMILTHACAALRVLIIKVGWSLNGNTLGTVYPKSAYISWCLYV